VDDSSGVSEEGKTTLSIADNVNATITVGMKMITHQFLTRGFELRVEALDYDF
jgi:hypothetical protein